MEGASLVFCLHSVPKTSSLTVVRRPPCTTRRAARGGTLPEGLRAGALGARTEGTLPRNFEAVLVARALVSNFTDDRAGASEHKARASGVRRSSCCCVRGPWWSVNLKICCALRDESHTSPEMRNSAWKIVSPQGGFFRCKRSWSRRQRVRSLGGRASIDRGRRGERRRGVLSRQRRCAGERSVEPRHLVPHHPASAKNI